MVKLWSSDIASRPSRPSSLSGPRFFLLISSRQPGSLVVYVQPALSLCLPSGSRDSSLPPCKQDADAFCTERCNQTIGRFGQRPPGTMKPARYPKSPNSAPVMSHSSVIRPHCTIVSKTAPDASLSEPNQSTHNHQECSVTWCFGWSLAENHFSSFRNNCQNPKSRCSHKMPESLSAFCRIVSLTAANTSRIFVVSVACVKLRTVSTFPKYQSNTTH